MKFTNEEIHTGYDKKYDVFHNAHDKEIIKAFDRTYGHMGFFPALLKMGLARVSEMYPTGAIDFFRLEEVNDVQEKFKACNDLMKMADYAKEQTRLLEQTHEQINLLRNKVNI